LISFQATIGPVCTQGSPESKTENLYLRLFFFEYPKL
jgi:hypothetical protein